MIDSGPPPPSHSAHQPRSLRCAIAAAVVITSNGDVVRRKSNGACLDQGDNSSKKQPPATPTSTSSASSVAVVGRGIVPDDQKRLRDDQSLDVFQFIQKGNEGCREIAGVVNNSDQDDIEASQKDALVLALEIRRLSVSLLKIKADIFDLNDEMISVQVRECIKKLEGIAKMPPERAAFIVINDRIRECRNRLEEIAQISPELAAFVSKKVNTNLSKKRNREFELYKQRAHWNKILNNAIEAGFRDYEKEATVRIGRIDRQLRKLQKKEKRHSNAKQAVLQKRARLVEEEASSNCRTSSHNRTTEAMLRVLKFREKRRSNGMRLSRAINTANRTYWDVDNVDEDVKDYDDRSDFDRLKSLFALTDVDDEEIRRIERFLDEYDNIDYWLDELEERDRLRILTKEHIEEIIAGIKAVDKEGFSDDLDETYAVDILFDRYGHEELKREVRVCSYDEMRYRRLEERLDRRYRQASGHYPGVEGDDCDDYYAALDRMYKKGDWSYLDKEADHWAIQLRDRILQLSI